MTKESLYNQKVGDVVGRRVRFVNPDTGKRKTGKVYSVSAETMAIKDRDHRLYTVLIQDVMWLLKEEEK